MQIQIKKGFTVEEGAQKLCTQCQQTKGAYSHTVTVSQQSSTHNKKRPRQYR